MTDIASILSAIKNTPVLVIGDVMLDRFVYGEVDRISPEGPIPVLNITREEEMIGGAGNVVSNLCALGAKPFLFAVLGHDDTAKRIIQIAKNCGADPSGIIHDSSRPTTIKTRFIARQQQLLRTDFEKIDTISKETEEALFENILKNLDRAKAVILSDYGKGVLTQSLIKRVIAAAQKNKILVLVDPKGSDYTVYRGADIITPNRKELAQAAQTNALKSDDEITSAAQKIISDCGVLCVVATRSEDGMSIIHANQNPIHLKTNAREVFDVSGAGDTVIATLAGVLAVGADIEIAAKIANIAGGIAVSKIGTAPVRADEILGAVTSSFTITDEKSALEQIQKWRAKGLKIGFTNGCFDILHKGHVTYLKQAREKCDRLIVALNHDVSVKLLKGPSRPINDQSARAAVLLALSSVDMVVMFGAQKAGQDNTPITLIEKFKPDVYFKGGDYKVENLIEAPIVKSYGGEVVIIPFEDGYSTTAIIEKSSLPSR